jgi:hypothetical protein
MVTPDPARRKQLILAFDKYRYLPGLLFKIQAFARILGSVSPEGLRYREFTCSIASHKSLKLTEKELRTGLRIGEQLYLWRYTNRTAKLPRKPKIYFYIGSELTGDLWEPQTMASTNNIPQNLGNLVYNY